MVTTYVLEFLNVENNYTVFEYSKTLSNLKDYVSNAPIKIKDKYRIIKLRGDYFGEGYHEYYLIHNGNKFVKTKLR